MAGGGLNKTIAVSIHAPAGGATVAKNNLLIRK